MRRKIRIFLIIVIAFLVGTMFGEECNWRRYDKQFGYPKYSQQNELRGGNEVTGEIKVNVLPQEKQVETKTPPVLE